MRYHFNPLTGKVRVWGVVGFDVEGSGAKGAFLLGVVYDKEGPKVFRSRERMAHALCQREYRSHRVFAHNLEYDWGCVFQDDSVGWSLDRLHSRLIKATYRDGQKHKIEFLDTGNLSYFLSLDAMAKIIGMEKLETPEWVKAGEGSKSRALDLSEAQWGELETYCTRDAEICYRYAAFIQGVVNELGGELKATLPATAMDVFRRKYLQTSVKTPHKWANDLTRQAYYGGRCEVFRYGRVENQYHYDVHSMYPAAMVRVELPDPSGLYFYQHTTSERVIWEKEGITRCRVVAPESHIPLLPSRIEGRLLFTTGEQEGAWCHNELRRALELGYKVVSIDWQLATPKTCNPLRGYVGDLYSRKVAAQSAGNPSYFIYKLFLNSIYGKFGQRCDGGLTRLVRCDLYPDFQEAVGIEVIEWQDNLYVLQELGGKEQPGYVIVLWAAYVTAEARLMEYELLSRFGDRVAYCDTDCAVGPEVLDTGSGLGELGLERGPATFEFRAPKYYRWRANGSAWHYKMRGIRQEFQKDFWATGSARYLRPTKIGESMRANIRLSQWITQIKTDRRRHLKRCPLSNQWPEGGSVGSRPWSYAEAQAMYEHAPPLLPWRSGGMVDGEYVKRHELGHLIEFGLRAELDALRGSILIPSQVIFELWDYRVGDFRRVRNQQGELVLGAYARVDELAQELGYFDGEALKRVIREQVKTYERIREIEEVLGCRESRIVESVQSVTKLPW